MPGEIIQINCDCGVHGRIAFGLSDTEVFLRLQDKYSELTDVFKYITIDKSLELQTLESRVDFLPMNDSFLIPSYAVQDWTLKGGDYRCPLCNGLWSCYVLGHFG